MFTSSLARRVGWVGLIALLAWALFCPRLIRESAAQKKNQKPQTQVRAQESTPTIEEAKPVKMEAVKISGEIKVNTKARETGTLKGEINTYQEDKNLYEIWKMPCQIQSWRVILYGFPVTVEKGTQEQTTGNATVEADCAGYEFKNVPPGTYRIGVLYAANGPNVASWCNWGRDPCPDSAFYGAYLYATLSVYLTVRVQICAPVPGGDPMCHYNSPLSPRTVRIKKGETTTLNLSVLTPPNTGY